MPPENAHIRNFCIIAHIDHGKSTLADRLLEATGTVEQARGARPSSSTTWSWSASAASPSRPRSVRMNYTAKDGKDYVLNLIDTPGPRGLRLRGEPLASRPARARCWWSTRRQGVEAQTLANVYLALDHDLEVIPVINKIDLPSADVERTRAEIEDVIGIDAARAVPASRQGGHRHQRDPRGGGAARPAAQGRSRPRRSRRWSSTAGTTATAAW